MAENTDAGAQSTGRDALRAHLRVELFRSLCDPTRVAILGRLARASRPLTVTEVSGCCGVHLSGVSRHLALLRAAGVVEAAKTGREVRYALDREKLTAALRGLADAIDECCPPGESGQSGGPSCC